MRARDHILRDGGKEPSIRVLLSGFACRYKHLPDGRRQITAFLTPGDICDFAFLSDSLVSQGIIAMSPVVIGSIDLDRFAQLVETHADVMVSVLRASAIENSATQELLVSLGGRNALHRVAHLLCEMHYRFDRAKLTRDGGSFDLPLTQSEIGEALGLSTVHVNRTVQLLKRKGLAIWQDRTVTLPDPGALANECGFDPSYLMANSISGE